MLRRVFAMLWVIAILVGCGADTSVETAPAVRPARLITVGAGDNSAPSQFVGKVAPAHTVELGFEIDGTLQQLPLPEGFGTGWRCDCAVGPRAIRARAGKRPG